MLNNYEGAKKSVKMPELRQKEYLIKTRKFSFFVIFITLITRIIKVYAIYYYDGVKKME
jgi:hypothetical protein